MDPNATLSIIRDLIKEMTIDLNKGGPADWHDTDGLVFHIQALDEWLSKGGYLPADWQGRS